MYRVHGDKIIRRRKKYKKQTDIQKYSSILKEDFHNMCGYCGKDFNIISCPYQKDHLIPVDVAKKHNNTELPISYENLVYSCRICNRNKWNQWPLDNIDAINNGEKGFSDPASEEFDECLCRNENGLIIAKNNVGIYMHKIFNFENRLTDVWWKLSIIEETMNEINLLIEKEESQENLKRYYQLNMKYKQFCLLLKGEKEMI